MSEDRISQALYQRGHKITEKGTLDDIFLMGDDSLKALGSDLLYKYMTYDKFRKALRDWTFDKEDTSIERRYVGAYLKLLADLDGTIYQNQKKYSSTFEWYVSELMKREFGAKASGFGIRLKDAHPDDEFDVVSVLDGGILYAECKTGKDAFEKSVKKFVRRDKQIHANYSVFIHDRDYTFTKHEEHDFPSFSKEEAQKFGIYKIERVKSTGYDFKFISCADRIFFECSAFKNLRENIRHMIRFINLLNDGQDHLSHYKLVNIPFKKSGK